MIRHGIWPWKVSSWKPREIYRDGIRGIWFKTLSDQETDICIYYIHGKLQFYAGKLAIAHDSLMVSILMDSENMKGGGFTMGSPYFYLEFLSTWASELCLAGFKNPSVFALDYTLVPDAIFPVQVQEAVAGYRIAAEMVGTGILVVAGDSAGGNITLSLLLHLARPISSLQAAEYIRKPDFATLISPWTELISPRNRNTDSDFLDADQLHQYGTIYAGMKDVNDPYKSPGMCQDVEWWREATPLYGLHIVFGSLEVFTNGIRVLISTIRQATDCALQVTERPTIHAWPVTQLFLGETPDRRVEGLRDMAAKIRDATHTKEPYRNDKLS